MTTVPTTPQFLRRELLFGHLFDDASIFPPGNAAMPAAVSAHLRWRASSTSELVGPFVCSSSRWDELLASVPDEASLETALTVPSGIEAIRAAMCEVAAETRALVTSVELGVERPLTELEFTTVALAVPRDVTVYVETPWATVDAGVCGRLAAHGRRLKIRTGGLAAESFPDDEQLGRIISLAVEQGVPFKLTAGLHHPIRHTDRVTGFEHHGFLNVMAATAAALDGVGAGGVSEWLSSRDSGRVVEQIVRLDATSCRAVRRYFTSFGTCSIREPIDDLIVLGLLQEEAG